jgi:uncharacterized alpha-E superfamily protein
MLSRVADSIFWMGRYIERAENVARFIHVNLHLILDLPVGSAEQWGPLVITSGDQERFAARHGATATKENVIQFLAFDAENPNSIVSCLRAARENARSVREIISSEMWEQVNTFYLMVTAPEAARRAGQAPHELFTEVKMASHLFSGLTETTMSHGEAWHFCRLGRLLERADKTTRLLDVKYFILLPRVADVGTPFDDIQWSAVLRSASAFEMYPQTPRRASRPTGLPISSCWTASFPSGPLLPDQGEESLHAISGTPIGTFRNPPSSAWGNLRSELAAHVEDILGHGLHEFLDGLQLKLNAVGDAIFETFFALRPVGAGMARLGGVQA